MIYYREEKKKNKILFYMFIQISIFCLLSLLAVIIVVKYAINGPPPLCGSIPAYAFFNFDMNKKIGMYFGTIQTFLFVFFLYQTPFTHKIFKKKKKLSKIYLTHSCEFLISLEKKIIYR